MLGIDTNVLVRYIAQDDAAQSARATRCIENECSAAVPGYVGLVVLVEVIWVSESCYQADRATIADIVRRLLGIKQLMIQNAEVVWKALHLFEAGKADFADCLIARGAHAQGCKHVVTFDKQAAKAGMSLLK